MKNILEKWALILALVLFTLSAGSPGFGSQQVFYEGNIQVAQESEFPASETTDPEGSLEGNDASSMKRIIRLTADEADGVVTIEMQGTGKLEYTAFKLLNPLRIVLDLPNMELGDLQTQEMVVDKGVVISVKPVYFEDTNVLRMEISLNVAASYEISQDVESQLLVRLKGAPSEETLALEPINKDFGDPQLPPVEEEAEALQFPEPVEEEAEALQLPEPVEEEAVSPPAESVETEEEIIQAQAPAGSSESGALDPCSDEESGNIKRISFDFQNANLKNILRIISEVAAFNLVLSSEVKGTINLKMTDVLWNKALEIILTNNGLAKDCEAGIMRVATEATLEASRAKGLLSTEMIRINYADLNALVASLGGVKSDRGTIKTDKRTSTIIVTDVPQVIAEMRKVIKILDKPNQQVTIAMQMIEINSTAAKAFGIGWGVDTQRTTGIDFPNNISVGSGVGVGADLDTGNADQLATGIGTFGSGNFQVDLASAILPTGSVFFQLASVGLNTILSAELRALESRGLSRTLSRPKVTTMDNTQARIRRGVRIPFITTTANEGQTVEFIDADLELNVTPHITADEKIFLEVSATKNSIGATVNVAGPTILTSEAKTEMLVDNGSTTVLGGLTTHDSSEGKRAVPFLGDIPWIGWLFKAENESLTVDELLIFITPTIVRN